MIDDAPRGHQRWPEALAIVRRLAAIDPDTFGDKQHSIVQRLLKALRRKAAQKVIAETAAETLTETV